MNHWKQRALYQLMSEISEECYCAGWMSGNEFTLWEMVSSPDASRSYGMGEVSESQIADLRAMSAEIGGWIRWHDDADDSTLPPEEWGPRFEPMAEWQARYDRQMAQWAELRAKYEKDTPA